MRRVLYYISVFLFSLLLLIGMLIAAVSSEQVQNAVARLVTAELSRGLDAEVSIGHIEYNFPARVRIHRVCLHDQQGDTLAYIEQMYAHFRPLALLDQEIRFSRVDVRGVRAHVYALPDGEYNFAFLARAFRSDKESAPFESLLSIRDIHIEDVQLRWQDYTVQLFSSDMDLSHLTRDSIDGKISHLRASVAHGGEQLIINDFQAHLQKTDTMLRFPTLLVRLPKSEVDASGVSITLPKGPLTTHGALHNTYVDLTLRTAEVQPGDLALLAPQLKQIDGRLRMTGHVHGAVDSVAATDLSLSFNKHRIFKGNISAVGLPKIDSTRFHIHCEDIHVSAQILKEVLDDLNNHPTELPSIVNRLNDVHFRGDANGRIRNLQLNGSFTTSLGALGVNGHFAADTTFRNLSYNAQFNANQFRLGELLGTQEVGNLSGNIRADGTYSPGAVDTRMTADISQLTLHGYNYHNMHIDGHMRPKQFDGLFTMEDPNARLHFNGHVDMTGKYPDIDCDLRIGHLRLAALNLGQKMPDLTIGAAMHMKLHGSDIDHMDGSATIDSLHLYDQNRHLRMRHFAVNAKANGANKTIHLTSDYLNADVNGQFYYEDLSTIAQRAAKRLLPPSMLAHIQPKNGWTTRVPKGAQNIHIDVEGNRLSDLLSMFGVEVPLGQSQDIQLSINDATGLCSLDAYQDYMALGNKTIRYARLSLNNRTGHPELKASATTMGYLTEIDMALHGDELKTNAEIYSVNPLAKVQVGDLSLDTRFRTTRNKPQIDLHMAPTQITFQDTTFVFDDILLSYIAADRAVRIDQLHAFTASGAQSLNVQGIASHSLSDALNIRLKGINAGYLMPLVVDEKSFKMGGIVDGWATLYAVMDRPMIEAEVKIKDYAMGDEVIGDADGSVSFDPARRLLQFQAVVADSIRQRADVHGAVNLASGHWEVNIAPTHIPLAFIGYWTRGFMPEIGGYGTGYVKVFGWPGATYVLTRAKAEDGTIRVPFTGCRYHINDTIYMDSTAIRFPHMILQDDNGNPIEFEGKINHNEFRDFNFHLVAKPHKAMVLDLPYEAGQTVQGRVYAEGEARIDGNDQLITINAEASTAKNSQFRLSLGGASSESESNFVHFVDSLRTRLPERPVLEENDSVQVDSALLARVDSVRKRHLQETSTRIKLGLNIETTPLLNFQLMLDERTGDMIQARGDGALRLTYDSHLDEYKLLGTYTAQSGSLGFTLANVIRRNFSIANGSTIVWNGNPADPDLNVTAKYHVTANLRDLFGDEISSVGVTRSSVPVNTCLNMTGRLSNPMLKFAIELPMSEEGIQNQVQAIINTEEMLMRQVVYLLVFGRFYTPDYMLSSSGYGLNETYSILSSTITGQINSWLGKLTDIFTMGIQVRAEGEGATASQEYEAQFQLQPVDRLIINGNVGYRYNDISNRPFFGDLDAEVLLTEDGQLRLKAYTHTVDKYSLRQANTIQGVGLLWRYNFNIPSKDQRKQLQQQRKARREAKREAKAKKKAEKKAE